MTERNCRQTHVRPRGSEAERTALTGRLARARRRVRQGAVLAFALLLGACTNPFKPAEPELGGGGDPVAEDWSSPEAVLATVAEAIRNRSQNGSSAYLHAFAESTVAGDRAFRAFYDGGVKLAWQSSTGQVAPEPWDIGLERRVHSELSGIRPTEAYQWDWLPDPFATNDDEGADTVQYHRKYELKSATENGTPAIICIGYVDLSMQRKEGRWSIYRWHDRADPTVDPEATDQRSMSFRRLDSLTQ